MYTHPVVNGLLSGAVAAVVAAVLHLVFLQPVLLRAEAYEAGEITHSFAAAGAQDHHATGAGAEAIPGPRPMPTRFDFRFDPGRDAMTFGFFLVTYSAFGLLLAAGVDLARRRGYVPGPGHAALWGAAGFASIALVPSFGLAPLPPGLAAAETVARQLWWAATAAVTMVTVASFAFLPRGRVVGGMGVGGLVILMFLVPVPAALTGPVPPELSALFATRALGISAVAWLVLAAAVLRQQRHFRVQADA